VTEETVASSALPAPEQDFSVQAAIDALDRATRAIAGELDVDRVLQLIVDSVRDLVHARYAAVGIVDAAGRIERFITSGISAEERAAIGSLPRGLGLLGLIIREGRAYRIPDIRAHEDAFGFPPNHPAMTSFLGVPIRTAGESVGNFYLTDKVGAAEFSEQDQRLVEMFALHAGIAIQNARLHARVQRLAVLDERLRIGRDLHDGIIQGIYAVSLSLEDVPELMDEDRAEASSRIDHAIDRLTTTISEIRTFIMGLGSDSGDVPIETALVGLADELLLGSGTRMALDLDLAGAPGVDEHLSPEAASQVLHIAREALSNALRHSDAGRIRVSLIVDGDDAVLSVEDDGRGFDPEAPRGPGHFGVANMHDRAATIGGTLQVTSRPGLGTRIIVRLPLSQQEIRPT
jgi:signal transduction histidine kinase